MMMMMTMTMATPPRRRWRLLPGRWRVSKGGGVKQRSFRYDLFFLHHSGERSGGSCDDFLTGGHPPLVFLGMTIIHDENPQRMTSSASFQHLINGDPSFPQRAFAQPSKSELRAFAQGVKMKHGSLCRIPTTRFSHVAFPRQAGLQGLEQGQSEAGEGERTSSHYTRWGSP